MGTPPGSIRQRSDMKSPSMIVDQEHGRTILADDRATSALENALDSAQLMKARGLRVHATDDSFFEVQQWWTPRRDRDLVVREYVKLLVLLVGAR